MHTKVKDQLIEIAKARMVHHDPSHDFEHALRVLHNAEIIAKREGGDLDVIIPAALFHDVVIYPKNDPRSKLAPAESAKAAFEVLCAFKEYPQTKISLVEKAIKECSFTKGIMPDDIEGKIVQDADKLEATGAISIMRTYASTGQMNRPFYHPSDPFAKKRKPDSLQYALDLFFTRLLIAKDRMHTHTAKKIAEERTKFLKVFLKQLKRELIS